MDFTLKRADLSYAQRDHVLHKALIWFLFKPAGNHESCGEMHMTVVRNVTRTAFVVAEFRAEENRELHPLYRDPIVHLFLDEESRKAADQIFASFPPSKTWSG
jgi:hypothetical protein